MTTIDRRDNPQQFRIVICPEPHVTGGLWQKWYDERCVAVGWPPKVHPQRPFHRPDLVLCSESFRGDENGRQVIPFLLDSRIGPIGTVWALRVRDDEWMPTVKKGTYSIGEDEPDLGRWIDLEWETQGMPPEGKVAFVPPEKRSNTALTRRTIREISEEEFAALVDILKDPSRWVELDGR